MIVAHQRHISIYSAGNNYLASLRLLITWEFPNKILHGIFALALFISMLEINRVRKEKFQHF
jgi:hypothetical protein